jgi:hypothetical protein
VRVHVQHVRGLDPGVLQRELHRPRGAPAARLGGRQVVRVRRDA